MRKKSLFTRALFPFLILLPFMLTNPAHGEADDQVDRGEEAGQIVEQADRFARDMAPLIRRIQRDGATTLHAVAERLNAGFVPVRKPGKLPAQTIREEYQLEYGTDCLEMHRDALSANDKVLIVDDLLATGGTAEATVRLVRSTGAHIVGVAFVIELAFLSGKTKLPELDVTSLILY